MASKDRLGDHEKRIKALEGQSNGYDLWLADLDASITTIEAGLNTVETQIVNLQGDLSNLETDVNTLQSQVAALQTNDTVQEGEISDLNARVSAVESVNLSQGATITTHTTNITSLQSSVTTLQSSDATQNSNISSHTAQLLLQSADIANLQIDVAALQPIEYSTSITVVSTAGGDPTSTPATLLLYKQGKNVTFQLKSPSASTWCPSDEALTCASAIPATYIPALTSAGRRVGLFGRVQLNKPASAAEHHQAYLEVDEFGSIFIYRVATTATPNNTNVYALFDNAVWGDVGNLDFTGNWLSA